MGNLSSLVDALLRATKKETTMSGIGSGSGFYYNLKSNEAFDINGAVIELMERNKIKYQMQYQY